MSLSLPQKMPNKFHCPRHPLSQLSPTPELQPIHEWNRLDVASCPSWVGGVVYVGLLDHPILGLNYRFGADPAKIGKINLNFNQLDYVNSHSKPYYLAFKLPY